MVMSEREILYEAYDFTASMRSGNIESEKMLSPRRRVVNQSTVAPIVSTAENEIIGRGQRPWLSISSEERRECRY